MRPGQRFRLGSLRTTGNARSPLRVTARLRCPSVKHGTERLRVESLETTLRRRQEPRLSDIPSPREVLRDRGVAPRVVTGTGIHCQFPEEEPAVGDHEVDTDVIEAARQARCQAYRFTYV